MSRSLKLYLIPILMLLAVTLPHLEQGEFRRDTVRYAAIGHYMWEGGSLLTPYANSEKIYFNKPPLALWIHGLFLKLFGLNLVAARLPSILAAIGVVLFSMFSVRNLSTRREAVISGVVLASTYEFFRRTREISLDMWQLFFIMIAVWLVTKTIRIGARWPIVACGIPIGLALMCKQLVALMVLPIFAVWFVFAGRASLVSWLMIGALPLSILVAAPWHFYMYSIFGEKFASHFFGREVVERSQRSDQHHSVFYYLSENCQTYWPWMIALFHAIWLGFDRTAKFSSRSRRFVLLGTIWVGIYLVAISLFADKKPNYALPLYPMLSWIAAWALCRVPSRRLKHWYDRGLPWLAPAVIALLIIAAIAPIQFQEPPEKHWLKLVNWMKSNGTDVAGLKYDDIEQSDVCYVYIKTGAWMKSLRNLPEAGEAKDILVVTKYPNDQKPSKFGDVIFSSGPVHVVSMRY
jgi:4-amino-4-deoxy-L-arabinose transferase-like glycosyltransferase